MKMKVLGLALTLVVVLGGMSLISTSDNVDADAIDYMEGSVGKTPVECNPSLGYREYFNVAWTYDPAIYTYSQTGQIPPGVTIKTVTLTSANIETYGRGDCKPGDITKYFDGTFTQSGSFETGLTKTRISDGKTETYHFRWTVTNNIQNVTGIVINATSNNVLVGSDISYTAVTSPANADDRHVRWYIVTDNVKPGDAIVKNSYNSATGGNCTVTATQPGRVFIYAEALDGSGIKNYVALEINPLSVTIVGEIEHGTLNAPASVPFKTEITASITPDEGYGYPESIRVLWQYSEDKWNELASNRFSYFPSSGQIIISGPNVVGNIKIIASMGSGDDGDFPISFLSPSHIGGVSGDSFAIDVVCSPSEVEIIAISMPDWMSFDDGILSGTYPEVIGDVEFLAYLEATLDADMLPIMIHFTVSPFGDGGDGKSDFMTIFAVLLILIGVAIISGIIIQSKRS